MFHEKHSLATGFCEDFHQLIILTKVTIKENQPFCFSNVHKLLEIAPSAPWQR